MHDAGAGVERLLVVQVDAVPNERRLAGEDFTEYGPQAEYVGPLIDEVDVATGLFRCHVRWSSQDAASLRMRAHFR